MILEQINSPSDVKKLNLEELNVLAADIRKALMNRLTKKGGHFGPNFGMVEAIIAMHYVFNSPKDKLVFDVSHQTYPHKMLTGRKDGYLYEEHFNDVSGYTNPDESEHDFFNVGHTSTSISLASGLAKARDLKGDSENIIAIIGDGSLSGGEALEGLNYAGSELESNFIIVVNDNQQSIAENHGGLYKSLTDLRESNGASANNIFKAFGLDYVYENNGNDIAKLIEVFKKVKDSNHPIVVHINTQKGKGYKLAEENKEAWHWCMPFDPNTGEYTVSFSGENYGTLTADYLLEKMKNDKTIVAVTAAMPTAFGFTQDKRKQAGKQFVDVGIAEEHAVALISGIAKNGCRPILGTCSTFIQRTYDQISQDLCINNNPATIVLNYASFATLTDVTHLGIFTMSAFAHIPNLVLLAPTNKDEYMSMLAWSIEQREHPVMILMPGNAVINDNRVADKSYSELNKFKVEESGKNVAILALGDFYQIGEKVSQKIKDELGFTSTLINPRFVSGIDVELLNQLTKDHKLVITLEDGILEGGFGSAVAAHYGSSGMLVKTYGLQKDFIDRYDVNEILVRNRLTPEQILEDIKSIL